MIIWYHILAPWVAVQYRHGTSTGHGVSCVSVLYPHISNTMFDSLQELYLIVVILTVLPQIVFCCYSLQNKGQELISLSTTLGFIFLHSVNKGEQVQCSS